MVSLSDSKEGSADRIVLNMETRKFFDGIGDPSQLAQHVPLSEEDPHQLANDTSEDCKTSGVLDLLGQYDGEKKQVNLNVPLVKYCARKLGDEHNSGLLWELVACYNIAKAIILEGSGHGGGAPVTMSLDNQRRFALAYTYKYLERERKQDALELLDRLVQEDVGYEPLRGRYAQDKRTETKEINKALYSARSGAAGPA